MCVCASISATGYIVSVCTYVLLYVYEHMYFMLVMSTTRVHMHALVRVCLYSVCVCARTHMCAVCVCVRLCSLCVFTCACLSAVCVSMCMCVHCAVYVGVCVVCVCAVCVCAELGVTSYFVTKLRNILHVKVTK